MLLSIIRFRLELNDVNLAYDDDDDDVHFHHPLGIEALLINIIIL